MQTSKIDSPSCSARTGPSASVTACLALMKNGCFSPRGTGSRGHWSATDFKFFWTMLRVSAGQDGRPRPCGLRRHTPRRRDSTSSPARFPAAPACCALRTRSSRGTMMYPRSAILSPGEVLFGHQDRQVVSLLQFFDLADHAAERGSGLARPRARRPGGSAARDIERAGHRQHLLLAAAHAARELFCGACGAPGKASKQKARLRAMSPRACGR